MMSLGYCVGRERANGYGTDIGFILVRGRSKYEAEKGYETAAPVPVDMNGNECTGKMTLVNEKQ